MVPAVGKPGSHFGGPLQLVPFTDTKGYIALTAFVINVIVAVALTFVFRALKVDEGVDQTSPADYHADAGDRGVEEVLEGEPGTAPTSR
jgi:SSS family solute:Na+ symporter